jgi:hypothetical protein
MLNYGQYATHHMKNPFLSRGEQARRVVVNIDEMLAEQNKTFV